MAFSVTGSESMGTRANAQDKRSYLHPAVLDVDATNVGVENWKVAEDGNGTVVRLPETRGVATTVHLTLPLFSMERVWPANATEENQEELKVNGYSVELILELHETLNSADPRANIAFAI
ncbi:MAG TPA: glycosyl hydrolase-related protein [Terriglobales bacterium]